MPHSLKSQKSNDRRHRQESDAPDCGLSLRVRRPLSAAGALLVAAAGTALIGGFVAGPTITLDEPDGLTTVRLDGIDRRDNSGFAVSDAGDVDGDGRADILIGAYAAAPDDKVFAGETYLVFGHTLAAASSVSVVSEVDLGRIAPGQGILLAGSDPHDRSGVSISSAGDVDGDGLDDILVGAHFADRGETPLAGETVVLFGRTLREAAQEGRTAINLGDIGPREAVTIIGPPGTHRTGWSVSDAGDVDGDGLDDVLIGGHADEGVPGKAAIVFGSALQDTARGSGIIDLAALTPQQGLVLHGIEADDFAGLEVAGAGDVDRDGHADILVGAFGTTRDGAHRVGAAHLVSGAAVVSASRRGGTRLELAALMPAERVLIAGVAAGDNNGRSVAGAGDVDGDGRDDILVGAWSAEPGGKHWCGEATIIFSSTLAAALGENGAGVVDLRALSAADGIVVRGAAADDFAGWSVSAAGDVDGDGLGDVLVGAYGVDPAGAAYVLFGSALVDRAGSAARQVIDLARLSATEGVRIDGLVPGSNTGFRVSGAGDIDGDGFDDVLIGAPYADLPGAREAAGQTFVVAGALVVAASRDGGVVRLRDIHGDPAAVGATRRSNTPGKG